MGILLTFTAGLALWIVLWGTGMMKSFDAFMIPMVMVLLAATVRVVVPHLPGKRH
jgi:hypothetical protein